METWVTAETNPQPWNVELALGFNNATRKNYPKAVPSPQLVTFQKALSTIIRNGNPKMTAGEVEVKIFIWRQMEVYRSHKTDRNIRKHQADATNMQKAIEDAVQGILIENDRNVRRITTEIVEQGHDVTGRVVISVGPYVPKWEQEIPTDIVGRVFEAPTLLEAFTDNTWATADVF